MTRVEVDRLKKQVSELSEEIEDLKHDKRSFRASNDRLNHDLQKVTEELAASKTEQENLRRMLEKERSENVALKRLVLDSQVCAACISSGSFPYPCVSMPQNVLVPRLRQNHSGSDLSGPSSWPPSLGLRKRKHHIHP